MSDQAIFGAIAVFQKVGRLRLLGRWGRGTIGSQYEIEKCCSSLTIINHGFMHEETICLSINLQKKVRKRSSHYLTRGGATCSCKVQSSQSKKNAAAKTGPDFCVDDSDKSASIYVPHIYMWSNSR